MTDNIDEILRETRWINIDISHGSIDDILQSIPRNPGLYSISTNAPKTILQQFGTRNDVAHYNLMNKINASDRLPARFVINQTGNNHYIVYNGHAATLRQRASEHFKGSEGTYGLAFFELSPLRDFEWTFSYLNLSLIENYTDSELLRTYLEQVHRIKIGWPILCSK